MIAVSRPVMPLSSRRRLLYNLLSILLTPSYFFCLIRLHPEHVALIQNHVGVKSSRCGSLDDEYAANGRLNLYGEGLVGAHGLTTTRQVNHNLEQLSSLQQVAAVIQSQQCLGPVQVIGPHILAGVGDNNNVGAVTIS